MAKSEDNSVNPLAISAEFGFLPAQTTVQAVSAGFSGALLWRIESGGKAYALKAWPVGQPAYLPLSEIHQSMRRARDAGLTFVPQVLPSKSGKTLISRPPFTLELVTWQPGKAATSPCCDPARVAAAVVAIAQLHGVWKSTSLHRGVSWAVRHQWQRLSEWTSQVLHQCAQAVRSFPAHYAAGLEILRFNLSRCLKHLQPWLDRTVPLQLCLGDIWSDHVLFTGAQVTGVVDYGGMRMDSPAQDLARLLGSLCPGIVGLRATGWNAYQPASDELFQLSLVLEETGRIVSMGNWLRWLVLERRTFREQERAEERFRNIVEDAMRQYKRDHLCPACGQSDQAGDRL